MPFEKPISTEIIKADRLFRRRVCE